MTMMWAHVHVSAKTGHYLCILFEQMTIGPVFGCVYIFLTSEHHQCGSHIIYMCDMAWSETAYQDTEPPCQVDCMCSSARRMV